MDVGMIEGRIYVTAKLDLPLHLRYCTVYCIFQFNSISESMAVDPNFEEKLLAWDFPGNFKNLMTILIQKPWIEHHDFDIPTYVHKKAWMACL